MRAYSYYSGALNVSSRLYYFLTPGNTVHRFTDARYLARGITDHSPLEMTLASGGQRCRPEWIMDMWRLQNRKEMARRDEVTKLYFAENTGLVSSVGVLWEAYKGTIRGAIIAGESGQTDMEGKDRSY